MLAEPGRHWTLDELAEQAMTSRATLVRLFRGECGRAPLAFLGHLRLVLARNRLRAGSEPIAVIAGEVGYESETAFSRAYVRQFAIAPGADRRTVGV
jgi:AraC family transcriptional activator of mtrCDE